MKRLTALLVLALLLAGCGAQETAPTTEPTETTVPMVPTVAVTMQELPESDAALPMFTLTDHSCAKIIPWGSDYYALFTTTGEVLKLNRADLTVQTSRDLACPFSAESSCIAATATQLCYFDEWQNTVFILDPELRTTAQLPIAEEILAGPVMASDFSCLYYCTDDGVRAMDISTGLSRLVRQEHAPIISLEGLLSGDTILHYTRLVNTDQLEHSFIQVSDGTLADEGQLNTTDPAGQVITWENSYAALSRLSLPMGELFQLNTGTLETGTSVMFFLPGTWGDALLLENGTLLVQTLNETGLMLELYDLTNGDLIGSTTVSQRTETFPCAQSAEGCLWLWDDHQVRLQRWDYTETSTGSKNLSDLQTENYTPEQVEEKRLAMETAYGLSITIVEKHSRPSVDDEWVSREHVKTLELLDAAMAKFPEGFFTAMQDTLAIELVDDFDPDTGVHAGTGSMDIGESLTIRVSMCSDLQSIFYHELFHAMELHIQSNTSKLTQWEDQNPRGFDYTSLEDYESGALQDSPYLTPGSNAAADAYALVSAREDRAQTFMYAMMEGEEARFESSVMEDKLEVLCDAIRRAFDWRKSGAVFPWEQYL